MERIRRGAVFLVAFVLLAVVVRYKLTSDQTLLESFYWLVITISSVGYSERSQASPQVQLFTIGVIFIGMSAAAYTIGGLIQLMAEGEIDRLLGYRKMSREIEKMKNHVIVCGHGSVGSVLTKDLLKNNVTFVVVDMNPDSVAEAQALGYLAMQGEATEESTLRKAGIEKAKSLISVLSTDADNVFLTLTAKNLNPGLQIIARGDNPRTESKLLQAGATRVVLPTVIGGRRISNYITHPHASELFEHVLNPESLGVNLQEVVISPKSSLVDETIKSAGARRSHRLLFVGIRRADGEMLFNPTADNVLHAGDTLIVLGQPDDVASFCEAVGL